MDICISFFPFLLLFIYLQLLFLWLINWLVDVGCVNYRIIGAVMIVMGLYLVLWGKSEEKKFAKEQLAIMSTTTTTTSEHSGIIRPASHAKAALTQPLLPSSTENVWSQKNPNFFINFTIIYFPDFNLKESYSSYTTSNHHHCCCASPYPCIMKLVCMKGFYYSSLKFNFPPFLSWALWICLLFG